MRLLFDHNLSPVLVKHLAELFPESTHVYLIGLDQTDDREICNYALDNDFAIVTKDSDYNDLFSTLKSAPKIIWIRRGNCPTGAIAQILQNNYIQINAFLIDPELRILVLY